MDLEGFINTHARLISEAKLDQVRTAHIRGEMPSVRISPMPQRHLGSEVLLEVGCCHTGKIR